MLCRNRDPAIILLLGTAPRELRAGAEIWLCPGSQQDLTISKRQKQPERPRAASTPHPVVHPPGGWLLGLKKAVNCVICRSRHEPWGHRAQGITRVWGTWTVRLPETAGTVAAGGGRGAGVQDGAEVCRTSEQGKRAGVQLNPPNSGPSEPSLTNGPNGHCCLCMCYSNKKLNCHFKYSNRKMSEELSEKRFARRENSLVLWQSRVNTEAAASCDLTAWGCQAPSSLSRPTSSGPRAGPDQKLPSPTAPSSACATPSVSAGGGELEAPPQLRADPADRLCFLGPLPGRGGGDSGTRQPWQRGWDVHTSGAECD